MPSNERLIHTHIHVPYLLGLSNAKLDETIKSTQGIEDTRLYLEEMLGKGITCLVINPSCDSRHPDGSCAGHPLAV